MKVHCLFEQSGTFKGEFIKLGIHAEDYDILNDFGETDHVTDIFQAILDAYDGKPSLFDGIGRDDMVMAFFPCTRFENEVLLSMRGDTYAGKGKMIDAWGIEKTLENFMRLNNERTYFGELITKLVLISMRGGWKLVIENPYSGQHYLTLYWPLKPALIDRDRTVRGDYFKKPTQFWFVNFEPFHNVYLFPENMEQRKTIKQVRNTVQRSMISKVYARRFILEHLIPKRDELMII